jgi:hypothetical protein
LALLIVNQWNAYCTKIRQGNAARPGKAKERDKGDVMKIYMLMALIGAIAAISHINVERKRPEGEA